jgi:hypothetical protein
MTIFAGNPLFDPRWDDLVTRHPRASVFHGRGWLEALNRTYGYEPVLLTSAPQGEPLHEGIVLCRVSSWVTGTRLVSMPFADHCEPLLNDMGDIGPYLEWLRVECARQRWKYAELRPVSVLSESFDNPQPACSYSLHELDITPALEQIFDGLHKDSVQRRIRRAERSGLSCDSGRSETLVEEFYRLLLKTRRRHRLLPQPRKWFRSLIERMGAASNIRVARKDGTAVAALLTLRHGSVVTYKYGCSDARFHHLGAMPFLFWRLIEDSKAEGAEKIDFGRSDLNQPSLTLFKDRLGSRKKLITYYRYSSEEQRQPFLPADRSVLRQLFSVLPDAVSSAAGRIVYKHIG